MARSVRPGAKAMCVAVLMALAATLAGGATARAQSGATMTMTSVARNDCCTVDAANWTFNPADAAALTPSISAKWTFPPPINIESTYSATLPAQVASGGAQATLRLTAKPSATHRIAPAMSIRGDAVVGGRVVLTTVAVEGGSETAVEAAATLVPPSFGTSTQVLVYLQDGPEYTFTYTISVGPAPPPPQPPTPPPSPSPPTQQAGLVPASAKPVVNAIASPTAKLGGVFTCAAALAAPAVPALVAWAPWLYRACVFAAFRTFAAHVVQGNDPPDANYDDIALPPSQSAPAGSLRGLCENARGRVCRRLLEAERRYITASARLTAMLEALAITSNRFATAQAAGDGVRQALQAAVGKTYFGLVASAQALERRAGRQLAAALTTAGLNLRLAPDLLTALAPRLEQLEAIPPALRGRFSVLGLDAGQIQQLVRQDVAAVASLGAEFDLRASLRRRIDMRGFGVAYRSITAGELARLVVGLVEQGVVSRTLSTRLDRHLKRAQRARNRVRRAQAIRAFRSEVRLRLRGRYGTFLQFAAYPLSR